MLAKPNSNQHWKQTQQTLRLPPVKIIGNGLLIQQRRLKRRRKLGPFAGGTGASPQNQAVGDSLRRSSSGHNAYASETMRPIVCLAFVLPLLLFYEFGSIFTDQLDGKSGIDRWLHQFMETLGFGHLVVLPILTMGVLLFWHHKLSDGWNFQPQVLLGMIVECCGLGVILYFAGNAVHELLSASGTVDTLSIGNQSGCSWSRTVAFIGCGVYEELIFRLLMLSGLVWMINRFSSIAIAKTIGTVVVSLLFSALHYNLINPNGADFETFSFIFRFSASVFFCVLFLFRGFGIAAGTHCTYDVLTQI